ncbi:non-ribosomal peptide synthase/polyketide synthase [Paenibacillus chartarius]|uniref:Non-ribosomal peptide synthase/polyketide synthase n=1 Tax=Paenibacillus chartarius TaxID=747481 RepID=A0ABV6DE17_9BACL
MKKTRAFWSHRFTQDDTIICLPYTRASKSGAMHRNINSVRYPFPSRTAERMLAIANGSDIGLFSILLAGVECLLHHYTFEENIIVATPAVGVPNAALVNPLILIKNQISGASSFRTVLTQLNASVRESVEHQNIPFQTMAGQLSVEYDTAGLPMIHTMVSLNSLHSEQVSDQAATGLRFHFELQGGSILLDVQYDANRYEREYISRMAEHVDRLFAEVLFQPDLEIRRIDILSEAERHQLLVEFNQTEADYPQHVTIHQWFEAQVERTPDRVAAVYEDECLTYRALNERANRLARTLRAAGVQADQLVGMMTGRSLEMIVGMLGILKAGGAYVPIDPEYPQERIHFMLDDSGARVLLTQRRLQDRVSYDGTIVVLDQEEAYHPDGSNLEPVSEAHHLAYVIYTSGTTGKPKGVMIEHRSVVNLTLSLFGIIYEGREHYRNMAQLAPYVFDMSVKPIYGSLLMGRTLHIVPEETRLDGQKLIAYFEKHDIDIADGTPTYLSLLLQTAEAMNRRIGVKHFVIGGEPLPTRTVLEMAKYGRDGIQVTNVYGPTECCVDSTIYRGEVKEGDERANVPIGEPLPNQTIAILNAEMKLVPIGTIGEIYISGAGVARGYLNRPELTAEKFIPNPYRPGERMYRTGDLGRWLPDGNIEYIGRADDQVKIRGYRIETGEIESRLNACEGVGEAKIIVREDESGQKLLCAYFTAGKPLEAAELRAALSKDLPGYMIPSYFVQLERLPLTTNGKIDRKALPAPEGGLQTGTEYVEPRTPLEVELAQIWQDVLKLRKIGVKDNFFELGGHSLRATALVSKIYKQLNCNVPLRDVFQHPTVEQLAKVIEGAERTAYTAIPVIEERNVYPVSSAQKRLYILSQLEGAELSYNMPRAIAMDGPVDKKRLEEALRRLIVRHETLRTGIELENGMPVQRIYRDADVSVEYLQAEQEEADALIRAFVRPFDLAKPPLLRVGLIELERERHILLLDMHHMISDAVSMGILIQEFVELYAGHELQPLRIQYKDYAAWQQSEVHTERMQRQESFWLDVFRGEIPVLDMPTDYVRPAVQSYEGALYEFAVGTAQMEGLRKIASQTGATLYMVLLAAYTVLLHKYTGQTDIVVGTPIAGRTHADLEAMIGMFVGTLAIRSFPSGEKTFADYVREMKEAVLKAYENQEYPFEELVDKLNLKRDLSRNPLFDTMFALQNVEQVHLSMDGLQLKPYTGGHTAAKFDLTLNAMEQTDGTLSCSMEYAVALYEPDTVARLAKHYTRLIEALADDPEAALASLEIVTEEEKTELLGESAAAPEADTGEDEERTIPQLFEAQAERTPEHTAVVFENSRLTYRELNERANRLARTLRAAGVEADQLVGIMAERSLEMIVGILAIMKAGGAYVPIDPDYPQERIRYLLDDSGAQLLLLQSGLRDRIAFTGKVVELDAAAAYHEDGSNLEPACGPDHLAYVIYTSGTTGNPKGVMIEHRQVAAMAKAWKHEYRLHEAGFRLLQWASFSFDVFTGDLVRALLHGGELILCPAHARLDPARIYELIAEHQVNMFESTPALVIPLMDYVYENKLNIESLQTLIVGSDRFPPEAFQTLFSRFGAEMHILNSYGVTEACIDSSYFEQADVRSRSYAGLPSLPVGKPLPGVRMYILNEHGGLQPIGVPGELFIGGAGVGRGYLNRPELTAEKFVDNPFVPGGRMYRTGDLARRLTDGNIEYIGRIDHQVKIRGHRIELGEVEAQLLKAAFVQEAVAVAWEDEAGQKQLCAYYVADKPLAVSELRKVLGEALPAYMVPSYFVQLERMPLTPNGKLDRKALPAPEGGVQTGAAYVAPRTPAEQALVAVWQAVLGTKAIGVLDNFFELGGDSIKSIQVASRLHQTGYKLEIKHLFKYPTVAELGPFVQPVARRADQGEAKGEALLTPIQRWFFEQSFDEPHHYNQSVMLYRPEGYDEAALRQAVRRLAEHHDALRLVFRKTETGFAAYNRGIAEGELYSLDVLDFRGMADCAQAIEAKANELQRGMDLQEGPLLKLGLFRCADGDHLLIVIHHLAVDGVSWRILFEDLAAGYEQALGGRDIRLPDKTDSYRLWAEQLAAYADSPAMELERAYWERIAQAEFKPLPRDYVQERASMQDSEAVTVQWTREETERLLGRAHKAYGTDMNDLLLTSLGMAVHGWTGMEQVAVSLEGHGREPIGTDIDVTRTVGWFTCEYPVVLEMKADQELTYRIKNVKESLRQIPNKGIGYGILKYMSSQGDGVTSLHQAPAPEISFNYLGQFDQDLQSSALQLSPYSGGQAVSGRHKRSFALDITGMIAGGQLTLTLGYSGGMYRKETMERLAGLFQTSLRQVIGHCAAKERTELTPSDVLFKGLTMEELERLQTQTAHVGEIENVYMLTPMQKGMLFHSLMDAQSGAYFEQTAFTLHGRLDVEAFKLSLDALAQRHAVLRTNFYNGWRDEPLQVVFRNKRIGFHYEDLRGLDEERRAAQVETLQNEDQARGFDLAHDALMRLAIVRTGDEAYRFLWSFHHILMDGWCLSLVAKDVFEAYFAIVRHRQPELAAANPYSRYIEWLERQDRAAASGYWSAYLAGYEHEAVLPQAKTRDSAEPYMLEKVDGFFDEKLTRAIHHVAKSHQVTVNTLMQTAWGILLQKYNGTQDAVFGSVVSGRPAEIPGIETMIGLFINTIPVRIRCEGGESVADIMRNVQEQALASQVYETYPLYEIQSLNGRKQDLFNHIVVFENYPVERQIEQIGSGEPAGFDFTDFQSVDLTTYDFNLVVVPGSEIGIHLEYNACVYDRPGMEQIRGHLFRIVEQIAANPDIRVSELELVTAEEKAELLGASAAALEADDTGGKTIPQLFEAQAERTPEHTAAICEDSRLTYRELNERANRLARTLRAAGAEADQLVGIMAERSLDMIVGILAIMKAGGAYVPIDPEYPQERIRYMLDDSGAQLLLLQSGLRERAPFAGTVVELDDAAAYHEDGSNLEPAAGPEHLAYVIYTSGTTGNPKGVMIEHRQVAAMARAWKHEYRLHEAGIRILQWASFSFDVFTGDFVRALLHGGELILCPGHARLDPARIYELIAEHQVNMFESTPSLVIPLMDYVYENGLNIDSLQTLIVGSDRFPPESFRTLASRFGTQMRILNSYGVTEACIDSSYFEQTQPDQDMNGLVSLPIGKPLPGVNVYILNEHGVLQPAGIPGELMIGGAGVGRGYLNRPELTAEKFADNPFVPGGRMYRTGDLARRLPDGNIEYIGRIDHQVKIRGNRVELGEVEAQILKAEFVQEAVVVAREDEAGQKQLCAYFVAEKPLAVSELRSALAEALPAYMVPSYFVQLERMPLTPNGKLDRKALPAPEGSVQTGAAYIAPRTPVEKALVAVWQAVLGTKAIGVLDNFFELGGDSIKSIQVASRLQQAGYKLEIKHLFKYPTVAELSPYVQPVARRADQGEAKGEALLTPIQRWFFGQSFDEPHHYNQSVMLYRPEGYDEAALRQAVRKLAEHHDALRLVFRRTESGYTAYNRGIAEGELYSLDVLDFRGMADCAQAIEAKANELQRCIDLQTGPLLKLGLFRCTDGDHLLIVVHHLAVDGVSWRILFEDLAAGYEQALRGQVIRLPEKTDSYRLWAEQLAAYAGSPAMESERAYWERIAQAASRPLPRDFAQERALMQDSEAVTVQWTQAETELLLKQAHRAYGTDMNDLLLTALGMAVHEWTGLEQVAVTLEGHGREPIGADIDITRTVGWFTCEYPVVLEMEADKGLPYRIKRVKMSLRNIPNKGIGYGILKYMSPQADGAAFLRQAPAPDISFNYLGQFDQDLQSNDLQLSTYSCGAEVSGGMTRSHALDVNGMIAGGQLTLTLSYSGKMYRKETMERLAEKLRISLREVIAHCTAKERTELTPSDILFKGLTIEELERIADQTSHIGEIENVYMLTPMQKGMLFHSLMDAQSGAYFEQTAFTLKGRLDVEAFKKSLDDLAERQAVLRTNFYSGWQDEPIQIVFRNRKAGFAYEDLRELDLDAERLEAYVEAMENEDRAIGFDLAEDALMRVSIWRTGDETYRFLWSFHHILMDGWCMSLITKEVFESYFAYVRGSRPPLAAAYPYSRYIEWLERQDREAASSYWSGYLAGYEHQTELPQTKAQHKPAAYVFEKMGCSLGQMLTRSIHQAAKRYQVTLNTLIQTVWGILLQKYNGTQDAVFGSVVSGRPAEIPGIENMVGLFINTIPVRVRCESGATFADVMQAVQEQALSSQLYETFPLYEIQALSQQKMSLINHIVVFENYPVERQIEQIGGGGAADFDIVDVRSAEQTNYDFNLVVMPGDNIEIHFEYNAHAYDPSELAQIQGHLVRIIEQIAENPQIRVNELELLTADEQSQLLDEWGAASSDYPREMTIPELFEEQAMKVPEQTALVFEGSRMTYRELNERANRLAHTLRAEGVQAEQPVGLMAERSMEMIVGILAILKAGGAYVPIDPEYPQERIRYMLDDSGTTLLLLQSGLRERAAGESYAGRIMVLDDPAAYGKDASNPERAGGPDNLAYVMYTSGTTGKPKGNLTTHRNIVRVVRGTNYIDITERDTLLQLSSYAFDGSTFDIFGALLNGARLVLSSKQNVLDMEALAAMIAREHITVMFITTALFNVLVDINIDCLRHVRKVLFGGERISVEHARRALHELGRGKLTHVYGPTESTVFATYYEIDEIAAAAANVPIGRPISNTSVYIVGADNQLQPIGAAGELCVAGDGLARGYLNRPELTAEKFADNPFAPGERMYRTGDLARWLPDGNIEYIGRIDQQVKIRGFRIELGEIEAQLAKLAVVREAVVIARDNEAGQKQLCAYFVADKPLTVSELRSELEQQLPAYMLPSYFVQLEHMPLTPNGKVDRKALPAPEESLHTGKPYVEPRTAVEQALVSVWQTVLGVKAIGISDNFFELGGDSIKSIQVSSRLHQAGYKLEIKHLFQYPTVAALSPFVQPVGRSADQGEVTGESKLTPIVRWFFENSFADLHHFNQAVTLYREDGYDEAALRQAMRAIAEHHDALRLVFRQSDREVTAYNRGISEGELYSMETIDFRGVADCAQAIEAKANELQRSIDLQEGPLLKLGLFRCDDGDHLLIVVHHLAIDGVSWRILFEDISAAYEQALQGADIRLPAKTDSFRTWAERLSAYAVSPAMEAERTYWEQLAAADCEPLPRDFAQEHALMRDSEAITVQWTQEETELLLKQAHRAYNTEVNDLLLTALGLAIHRWTGLQRVAVELEGHGREPIIPDVDITRTVGWFTSQYPVVLEMDAGKPLAYRIKSVKEGLRRIPNKGIGYGILKYMSVHPDDKRARAFAAKPDISFNYLGQFDQDLHNNALQVSPYPSGRSVSDSLARTHALDVSGMIAGGKLALTLDYSGMQYRRETMERLAGLLGESLKEVLAHCAAKERVELTPSDVLFKGLSIEDLERIAEHTGHIGEIENVYPLTPMQKGMLFHSLMEPQSAAYFEQASFTLQGSLDVRAFAQSLEQLVERHAVLRTNFYSGWNTEPLQVVYRSKAGGFYYEDIRGMDADRRDAYVAAMGKQDKARGFDLAQDALIRVSIVRTDTDTYRFLWSFHHILMDGWCLSLVAKEVFETYFAIVQRRQPEIDAVWPYSQYLEWLERQDREAAANYWRGYLAGYEHQTVLPLANTAGNSAEYAGEKLEFSLGGQLTRALEQAAKRQQVTMNSLMQTVWGILLHKYNGTSDVVFGSVVSGRPAEIPGIESMIGLFINTIPVRVRCKAEDTFAEAMRRVQEQALASQAYDTYPLYEIQALTEQKQGLVGHILVFENYPVEQQMQQLGSRDPAGFDIADVEMADQTNYDFNVIVVPGEELEIQLEYNANVYDKAGMERIRGHLVRIMEQIAENADIRVSELELLTADEREQITELFNGTDADYPREMTIHQLFEEQAERTPNQAAVEYEGRVLTYRELNERANRLTHTLRAEGVQSEQLVGIMAERSIEMVVGILAILKAGGAYVPIDPEYPQERIRFMLDDSGAKLLLVQRHLRDSVTFAGAVIELDNEASYGGEAVNLAPASGPKDLAYVIYTSGTTGKPKGTLIEHKNVVRLLFNDKNLFDFCASDTWTLFHSFCFDFSVWEMYGALLYGGKLVIVPSLTAKSPKQFLKLLHERQVTILNQTPTYFYQLLQEALSAGEAAQLSLRKVIFGGEALSPYLLKDWKAVYPDVQLINMYGITETTVHVTYKEITEAEIEQAKSNIGKPIPTLRTYILDEQRRPVPVGVAGELYVAGDGLARGYLNRPDLTAEKFVDNPFAPGERMYRAGDLARWLPDGSMEYLGRIDHQVKIRGYRIELGEIEAQLAKAAAVQEAIVIAREDGAGQKQLAAYFVAEQPLSVSGLRSELSQVMPAYMLPTYFVQLERMPLTSNGKVDRKALPAPEESVQTGADYTAPRTPTEAQLVRIWQQVLGVRTIGVKDNFFDLGGHSLRATTLVTLIHKELNRSVPLRDVFESPTIEQLAQKLEAMEQSSYSAIPPAEVKDFYPVSSAQKRLYLLHQMEDAELSYNMPGAMTLDGPLDLERFEAAFRQLIARHETLRTGFETVHGEPVQRVHAETPFNVEYSRANGDDADDIIRRFVRAFELDKPPLLRVGLIELEANRRILLFDMHHIISDGVSMGILVEEFVRSYKGEELPPLRLQYKDYAAWQQSERESERLKRQEAYWLEAFSGELPVLQLPTSFERPAVQSHHGDKVDFAIDANVCEGLRRLTADTGTTMYMVILAAYTVLLHKYSGQTDIIVGTPIAGRTHADLEPLIGMFVNTLAIRNYPAGEKTFLSFLEEVRQTTLKAYEHQDYPFEELVGKLQLARDASRNPLFDTMFVLQNTEMPEIGVDSLHGTPYEQKHTIAKFDLTLEIALEDDGIRGHFEYCTKLFTRSLVEQLTDDFQLLLSQISERPELRLLDMQVAENSVSDEDASEDIEFIF